MYYLVMESLSNLSSSLPSEAEIPKPTANNTTFFTFDIVLSVQISKRLAKSR